MPRTARVVIADYPHHVIQRGHNRQVVFAAEDDYLYYLENLREWKQKLSCRIYAYCLMANHVHLIIDPGPQPENLAKLMKRVAARQTRYVNHIEKRTGTLWEGRYKSSPISTNEYLLACCRYVELNPVRAGLAGSAVEYRWSSYRPKAGEEEQDWLDRDPLYKGLDPTEEMRCYKYKAWIASAIPDGEWERIRQSVQRGQLTGNAKFVDEIEEKLERRVEFRGQGRPRKRQK